MASVYLGVLRGYSDSTSEIAGNFDIYLHCTSITRENDNSDKVIFKDCYIEAVPVNDYWWTSNTLYIDSVSINGTSLGISDSWVGREYWRTASDGEPEYLPKGHTTKKATKTISILITESLTSTTKVSGVLYGHRSGTSKNSQDFPFDIDVPAGWTPIDNKLEIDKIDDNEDNTVTVYITPSSNGINNILKHINVYGAINGKTADNKAKLCGSWTYDAQNTPTPESQYPIKLDYFDNVIGNQTISIMLECKGERGDTQTCTQSGVAMYYQKPQAPTNLAITNNLNKITISATLGADGSNNPAKELEIYYTTNGDDPKETSATKIKYTGEFEISENTQIRAAARTVGTYVGNNEEWLYSTWAIANNQVEVSPPFAPSDLQIVDGGNNTYYLTAIVGIDGDNNSSTGVRIEYAINDDTDEEINWQSQDLWESAGTEVKTPTIKVSRDMTIKAKARTIGSVDGMPFSEYSNEISKQILYYSAPIIHDPVITYEKKLTKKSIINVKQYINLYKNSKLISCRIGLYKDNNNNGLADEQVSEVRLAPVIKFPYSSNEGGYQCSYISGKIMETNGARFEVAPNGQIYATYSNDNTTAKFFLNDYNGLNTQNGINLIVGKTYQIKDCMLYYKRKTDNNIEQDEYVQHGQQLEWKDNYRFIAVYIQQGVGGTWDDNTKAWLYDPKILYINNTENDAMDEIYVDVDTINEYLEVQGVTLGVDHQYNLSEFDIKKDDLIYVKLVYNVQNGAGDNMVDNANVPSSKMHLVKSSGVMRVNVGNSWYEGQVWVNVGGTWKEATDVFVNVNNNWKESV